MKTLCTFRGIPGGGKSTAAHLLVDAVCEADQFMYNEDGVYDWKPEKIKMAHEKCQNKCKLLMELGVEKIAVSNTSTTEKELKPYYDLAFEYGYRVVSLIVENRHGGVNTHNVPEETIQKMKNRFQIQL